MFSSLINCQNVFKSVCAILYSQQNEWGFLFLYTLARIWCSHCFDFISNIFCKFFLLICDLSFCFLNSVIFVICKCLDDDNGGGGDDWHVNVHLLQHNILERLSFLHWIVSSPLPKITWLNVHGSFSEFSILPH